MNGRIHSLESFGTVDGPGTRFVVFVQGCPMRCLYCHNPDTWAMVGGTEMTPEEVYAQYKRNEPFYKTGGITVTGGEPLIHKEIPSFLEKVKALGFSIKLDTNGSFPEMLESIVKAGLVDRVAMDIKNCPEKYAETIGLKDFDIAPVERSKSFLMECGIDYEFRTTVVKGIHTEESLLGAAEWIAGAKEYYLQQFKDSGDVIAIDGLSAYDEKEMHALADAVARFVPAVKVRGV